MQPSGSFIEFLADAGELVFGGAELAATRRELRLELVATSPHLGERRDASVEPIGRPCQRLLRLGKPFLRGREFLARGGELGLELAAATSRLGERRDASVEPIGRLAERLLRLGKPFPRGRELLARGGEVGLELVATAPHLGERRDAPGESLRGAVELVLRLAQPLVGLGERGARALELRVGALQLLLRQTEFGLERDDAPAERSDLVLEQRATRLELAELGVERGRIVVVDRQQRVVAGASVLERGARRLVGRHQRLHLGVDVGQAGRPLGVALVADGEFALEFRDLFLEGGDATVTLGGHALERRGGLIELLAQVTGALLERIALLGGEGQTGVLRVAFALDGGELILQHDDALLQGGDLRVALPAQRLEFRGRVPKLGAQALHAHVERAAAAGRGRQTRALLATRLVEGGDATLEPLDVGLELGHLGVSLLLERRDACHALLLQRGELGVGDGELGVEPLRADAERAGASGQRGEAVAALARLCLELLYARHQTLRLRLALLDVGRECRFELPGLGGEVRHERFGRRRELRLALRGRRLRIGLGRRQRLACRGELCLGRLECAQRVAQVEPRGVQIRGGERVGRQQASLLALGGIEFVADIRLRDPCRHERESRQTRKDELGLVRRLARGFLEVSEHERVSG